MCLTSNESKAKHGSVLTHWRDPEKEVRMPRKGLFRRWLPRLAAGMVCGLLPFTLSGSPAVAQDLSGLEGYSPVISLPWLRGEMKGRVTWVQPISGNQNIPDLGINWDLKDNFDLSTGHWLVDYMLRVQLSRLSGRFAYEIRDFTGTAPFQNVPGQPSGGARFTYTGIRLGADFDIVQRNRSRFGIDMDFDLYSPNFTESIQTSGGKSITGPAAITLGIHGVYNPVFCFWGVSTILEGRARWPISDTKVTDWELSAGLVSPETMLGTMALKGGYRHTRVQFKDSQAFQGANLSTDFDIVMSGVFGELVYYY